MRRLLTLSAASLAVTAALVSAQAPALAQAAPRDAAVASRGQPVERTGQIYLIRGLLNVFSLGMDELTEKLERRGYRASVHGHGEWELLADRIAQRVIASGGNAGPVVLIGHSLGGDAIVMMAQRLERRGIPVDLLVAFDPTKPPLVPGNVRQAVNLFQSDNGWGVPIRAGAGFTGRLENIDLRARNDLTHTSIDKANDLHAEVIRRIQALGGPPPRAARTARRPAPAAVAGPTASTQRAAVRRAPGSNAVSSSSTPATTGSVPAAPAAAVAPPAAAGSPPAAGRT